MFKPVENFVLQGDVRYLRLDDELALIDKQKADEAFKVQKKRLDTFMKENGFARYKAVSYIRRNDVDVLEYVNLQKEAYGSRTFTVNYALIALTVKHEFLSWDLSDRLGVLICGKDVWWDYGDEKAAQRSFDNVMEAITTFLFPWFKQHADNEQLIDTLIKKQKTPNGHLSNIQKQWLKNLQEQVRDESVIAENCEVLRLPKSVYVKR